MKTRDFQGLKVRIDRPKGFVQEGKDKDGKPWKRVYSVDYGFLPKTKGGDGDGVDVFLGPDENAKTSYWVVQSKDDGSFDEYKVILGVHSAAEARAIYDAHIPAKFRHSIAAISVEMMKAMLNVEPDEKIAFKVGFFAELQKESASVQLHRLGELFTGSEPRRRAKGLAKAVAVGGAVGVACSAGCHIASHHHGEKKDKG